MNESTSTALPGPSSNNWEQVFEAALTEADPAIRERRLQSAKDAIMDRIEDSFQTASLSERRLLMAALNATNEFQRLSKVDDLLRPSSMQPFSHIA
jgi:hypothetical protein